MHKRIEQQETYMPKHDRAWLHVLVRYALCGSLLCQPPSGHGGLLRA